MEREVRGWIRIGNPCKPMADSFKCMTKLTTIIKKKKERKEKVHLPMQGTLLLSLILEDPECCGATKPVMCNY